MLYIPIVAGILGCAILAISARRLLISALWLAATSALVALMMYLLGAPEVAVIELSVGAGLVTILFVFAINIAGEEPLSLKPLLPKSLIWIAVAAAAILLGWFSLPAFNIALPVSQTGRVTATLWENRGLDVMLQALLIFTGVLGVIGLLAERKGHPEKEHER